jgi:uncharacterized protein (TIGR02145 family)
MPSSLLKFEVQQLVKIGGRRYPYVKIGNQLWISENLDYKWNGLDIGTSSSSFIRASYINNDEATYGIEGTYKCGIMYSWYAVNYLNTNRATLLPEGWHVPSQSEWDALISTVGSNPGTRLKALNNSVTSNWPSGWNGTDDYGFNALPGGATGGVDFGSTANFQCSDQFAVSTSPVYVLNTGSSFTRFSNSKSNVQYVRLVKTIA